jgi:serine/threonine protein phosphatase 1
VNSLRLPLPFSSSRTLSGSVAPLHGSVGDNLVYAVGDVHGCYDLLALLLSKIADDVASRSPLNPPVLILCGDYVDRGPDSRKVLETLIWLQNSRFFELHLLKGNHEEAMLSYIAHPAAAREWVYFGGAETLQSYGVAAPARDEGDAQHRRARDLLLGAMPASHLHLLQTLELGVTVGDFAFVHAGIKPGRKLAQQTESDLLWIRREFLTCAKRHEKVIVHGHSFSSAEPVVAPNRIGIDTGSYETGVLTALRLTGGAIGFIHARGQMRCSTEQGAASHQTA